MSLEFKSLEADCMEEFNKYSIMRDIYLSESQFVNQFIWSNYYKTRYYANGKYLLFLMEIGKQPGTMAPLCKDTDILEAFLELKKYFNEELNLPLKVYNVDKLTLEVLEKSKEFNDKFEVKSSRDTSDYMYDAEKLKTLRGRAYHKKKNHLNHFLKNYEGRYEYKTLNCSNIKEIQDFHLKWLEDREIVDEKNLIDSEEVGVFNVFDHCSSLDSRMGGIYVDGKLSAYSIGSYSPRTKCAFIHIEKADPSIKGLYNLINQQFLIHEFPDAFLVNREDDLGHEGLRQSKKSYNPIYLVDKFHIYEK